MPRALAGLRGAVSARSVTVLLGSTASAAALLLACTPEVREPCGGSCGPGTECVEERCQPVVEAAPAKAEPPRKRKRRGKRVRKTGAPANNEAPAADEPGGDGGPEVAPPPFVAVDDSRVPQFNNDAPQTIDLKAGSERLSESELDRHIARLTPAIERCITTASAYGEIGAGSLKFKLRVLPSGKVESVSLTTPAGLRVWGIPSCARRAVFDHRFPSYDGAAMVVSFGVDVD